MEPARPGSETWTQAREGATDTRRLVALTAQGQAEMNQDRSGIDDILADVRKDWAGLSTADQAARTLNLEDGEGGGTAAPAAAIAAVQAPADRLPPPPAPPAPTPPPTATTPGGPEVAPHAPGEGRDVVLLRNGGRLRGSVRAGAGDEAVSITLVDGSVRSFKSAEIRDIQYGGGSPVVADAKLRAVPAAGGRAASGAEAPPSGSDAPLSAAGGPPAPAPAGGSTASAAGPQAAARAKVNCNPPYDVDDQNRKVFKPECYLKPQR
jgi:hypothetical protein